MADKEGKPVPQELSELGRKLSQARRVVTAHCEWCGKEITGIGKAKYCGASHRFMAYRKRKQERERAASENGG